MVSEYLLIIAAGLIMVMSAGAQADESDRSRDRDRTIHYETTVEAPAGQVWQRWTTEEGIKTFFSNDCKIDARVGGAFEIYFNPDTSSNERGSEGCVFLALQENKMLSFTWNAPPTIPATRNQHTAVVIRLIPTSETQTRLTLTQYGWGEGQAWDETFDYFTRAWKFVLNNLEESFREE